MKKFKKFMITAMITALIGITAQAEEVTNYFHEEELVEKEFKDLKYKIPKSWEEKEKLLDGNVEYSVNGAEIGIVSFEPDIESLDEMQGEDREKLKDSIESSYGDDYDSYELLYNEYDYLGDTLTLRTKMNGKDGESVFYQDTLILVENSQGYTAVMICDTQSGIDYKNDFELFLKSISLKTQGDDDDKKDEQSGESMILGTGTYIVGEDIPEGKYDFNMISGGGSVYIYENFDEYNNGEIWDKYFHLGAEGTKYLEKFSGYSTSASNIRLTQGKCLVISSGMEIEVIPK